MNWFPLLLLLLLATPPARADVIASSASVLTADIIVVDGTHVSLRGIRVPGVSQTCGSGEQAWLCGWEAADRLEALIGARPVTCSDIEWHEEGEATALCRAGDDDLAGLMVDEGYAVAEEGTGEPYRQRAMAALESGAGVWPTPGIDPTGWGDDTCSCSTRKQALMDAARERARENEQVVD